MDLQRNPKHLARQPMDFKRKSIEIGKETYRYWKEFHWNWQGSMSILYRKEVHWIAQRKSIDLKGNSLTLVRKSVDSERKSIEIGKAICRFREEMHWIWQGKPLNLKGNPLKFCMKILSKCYRNILVLVRSCKYFKGLEIKLMQILSILQLIMTDCLPYTPFC